jgi:hypothetical protein
MRRTKMRTPIVTAETDSKNKYTQQQSVIEQTYHFHGLLWRIYLAAFVLSSVGYLSCPNLPPGPAADRHALPARR